VPRAVAKAIASGKGYRSALHDVHDAEVTATGWWWMWIAASSASGLPARAALVVWGGEFGRTSFAQGTDGRDHNPYGFPDHAFGRCPGFRR
jgi:hypothetical protein